MTEDEASLPVLPIQVSDAGKVNTAGDAMLPVSTLLFARVQIASLAEPNKKSPAISLDAEPTSSEYSRNRCVSPNMCERKAPISAIAAVSCRLACCCPHRRRSYRKSATRSAKLNESVVFPPTASTHP